MIDALRFQHLRSTARLSQRTVAHKAGVTVPVVRAVEEGRSAQLTMRTAGGLAEAIGTKLSDIVSDVREDPSDVEVPATESEAVDVIDDARRLEALLFNAGRLFHHRAAAKVLEISFERLKAAAAYLEAQNESRGIHFYRLNVQYGLKASGQAESTKELHRLARQMTASDGLNRLEARTLFEFHLGSVMTLPRGDHRRHAHATHERLLASGLLVRDEANRLSLSREIRLALEPGMPQIAEPGSEVVHTTAVLPMPTGKSPPGNQE
jgi:transcriptional regulator with XRE-family HTH domain